MISVEEAIRERHSVRQYEDRPIPAEIIQRLKEEIDKVNVKGDLNIQLVTDEPKAFSGGLAHYGKFSGVSNYFVLAGKPGSDLHERCGFYGEHLVLLCQRLGLNTCWVGLTFKKIPSAFKLRAGEKLVILIPVGFGVTQGNQHKSKNIEKVSNLRTDSPEWFRKGVNAALLAPTAVNQQKFFFKLENDRVKTRAGAGFFSKVDLGIAEYHFEAASGKKITGYSL
ncbi:nitroreductase family protein [Baileyella intestinalis]|uniref:nitroreductase family protein n=1 Tax=Baileyella intestinalis TaxID=2606709 RepID=UPI0012B1C182|nr:nitroreductase family protein [Baileyella intestinalis]